MRRPYDRADLLEPDPDGSTPGGGAPAHGDPDLAVALQRCAEGDRGGVDVLRAWQGGQLRDVLLQRKAGTEGRRDS